MSRLQRNQSKESYAPKCIASFDEDWQMGTALQFRSSNAMQAETVARQVQEAGITTDDLIYEQMAHRMVYQAANYPEDDRLLRRWGYNPDVVRVSGEHGFQAALFLPASSGRPPVVAFRGTEPTKWEDIRSDFTPTVGQDQFAANRPLIEGLFAKAGGSAVVVGHSLGGALAQLAAVHLPDRVLRVVGFQAPGLSQEEADQLRSQAPVRHHLATGDMVDLVGQHLPGEFFVHQSLEAPSPVGAHISYLLLSPQFEAQRRALGLSNEVLDALDQQNNTGPDQPIGVEHAHREGRLCHSTAFQKHAEQPNSAWLQGLADGLHGMVGSMLHPEAWHNGD